MKGSSSFQIRMGLGFWKCLDEAFHDGILVGVVAGVVQWKPAVNGSARGETFAAAGAIFLVSKFFFLGRYFNRK